MCGCGQVCAHTCAGVDRSERPGPQSPGLGPHPMCLGVQGAWPVWAGVDETWACTGGRGQRQALAQYSPGPTWRGLSFGPEDLLSNGETKGSSLPQPAPPRGGLLPVNPGEPALPRPSHNMGLRQVSPRPPAKERDKDGPWERCRDRSRQRSGIESWNRVLLWPCSSEQGQGTAVEFCSWMWASRSPREPWPLLWGGDSCRGGSPHWRVSSPLRASVSSPVEQRVPPPPRSPLEGWRPKVISGTRQWSRHALLPDWEWGDEPGPGEEGAE